jgi:hypothetical protein
MSFRCVLSQILGYNSTLFGYDQSLFEKALNE